MLVGTKEIKKVAEARMRKKKRAANTLKAAKKSATMMAENSEMSEKQKLKVLANLHFHIKNNTDILSNELHQQSTCYALKRSLCRWIDIVSACEWYVYVM